jgi:NAD(P)-dependent dehydrogenase (short-subunit alcohol dehydrogenase family)
MDLRLDGKVALVTGASRGIGQAIAQAYVDAGAKVMLVSRKQDAIEAAAKEIGGPEGSTAVFAANAGETTQAEAAVQATLEAFGGRLDILVNNAATNPYMGRAIEIDEARYDKTFQVNLRGPFFWTQKAWELAMKDSDTVGSVINIASIGGMQYGGHIGVYDNTKAALIHLTGHFAAELSPKVRVNAIAPGLVKTDFARALWEPAEEQVAKRMPLRRLGTPEDIANAALFLASDAASWMTGHTMVIDGGAMVGRGAVG